MAVPPLESASSAIGLCLPSITLAVVIIADFMLTMLQSGCNPLSSATTLAMYRHNIDIPDTMLKFFYRLSVESFLDTTTLLHVANIPNPDATTSGFITSTSIVFGPPTEKLITLCAGFALNLVLLNAIVPFAVAATPPLPYFSRATPSVALTENLDSMKLIGSTIPRRSAFYTRIYPTPLDSAMAELLTPSSLSFFQHTIMAPVTFCVLRAFPLPQPPERKRRGHKLGTGLL